MNNFPLISIVTVTYNAVSCIEKTIKSVIEQSYLNIEYIIIDGKSTDGTLEIINKYRSSINILISEKDNGIYDAMNKALHLANGDYLIFLNAGDYFISNKTIEYANNFMTNKKSIYYGDVYCISNDIKSFIYRGGKFSKYRLMIENICHQSIFYPSCIYKNTKYNLEYKFLADWAYNIQHYNHFIYIPVVISFYDLNGISSNVKDYSFYKNRKNIIKKYWGLFEAYQYDIYIIIRRLFKLSKIKSPI